MFDKIFKISLIVIGIIFLLLYYQNSNTGRYQYITSEDQSAVNTVFDTKTGVTYIWFGETKGLPSQWMVISPTKGKATTKDYK